jgi:hypothetical protein
MWWLYAILILLIFIAIVVIIFMILKGNEKPVEPKPVKKREVKNITHTYFRFSDDLSNKKSMVPIAVFKEIMDSENIKDTTQQDATIYLFETLNTIDHSMDNAKFGSNASFIFGIKGTDSMVSKSSLVYYLRQKLGPVKSAAMLPVTYIYGIKADMQMLYEDIKTYTGIYILKKNIQRQEGNMISLDPQTVFDGGNEGYVVVQRMLLNPLCINNHKINMRLYLFVVVEDTAKFYIYNNGFIYYSPKKWNKLSNESDVHITSGRLDDRSIYDNNPQSFNELRDSIGQENYDHMWGNIVELMRNVKITYEDQFAKDNQSYQGTNVSIYGCDIAPDEMLDVKLMEINKGPDLTYKDSEDKKIKFEMVHDLFGLLGIVKPKNDLENMILL